MTRRGGDPSEIAESVVLRAGGGDTGGVTSSREVIGKSGKKRKP